jgi:ComF family protein
MVTAFWQEFFFPSRARCIICGRLLSRKTEFKLCSHCLAQLNFTGEPLCQTCGRPLRLAAIERGKCALCRQQSYYFTQARAVAVYEGFWRECIHMIKYFHRHDLVEPMVGLLAQVYKNYFPDGDALLVPIPVRPDRKARRGYDHVQILALELGRRLNLLVESGNLYLKDAGRQPLAEVLTFALHQPAVFRDRHIVLIDDILTTGRTASECARILLNAGAERVDVLTLAVGTLEGQVSVGKATVRR